MSDQTIEQYEIESNLRAHFDRYRYPKTFSCGEPLLDSYYKNNLKRALRSDNVSGLAAINLQGEVIAFCTLTFLVLERAQVFNHLEPSNQLAQIPAVKVSMLAVDRRYQKRGIGCELLMAGLEQALKVHEQIPLKGIYLDASSNALAFYQSLGFVALEVAQHNATTPMFMPIRVVAQAMAEVVASPS